MVTRSRLKSILTGLALYTMAALMVGYFGVNAYTGKYGLNARQELDQEIIALTSELARALVEHIRVDPVGAQQRDALLALGTLPLQPRQFRCQRDDLLVELLPRIQPILAGIGIDAEIADHRRRHRVEGKPGEQGFESRARDHDRQHAMARLTQS